MSTSELEELADTWRRTVLPCLDSPSDFDEALEAAREYHTQHPVEHGLLQADPAPPPERRENVFDDLYQGTVEKLEREHREGLMQFFIKKNVRPEFAEQIVDALVLIQKEWPPPS